MTMEEYEVLLTKLSNSLKQDILSLNDVNLTQKSKTELSKHLDKRDSMVHLYLAINDLLSINGCDQG